MEEQNQDQIFDQELKQELPSAGKQGFPDQFKIFFRDNKLVIIVSVVMLVLVAVVAVWVFRGNGDESVVSNNVVLQIRGPDKTTSGNEAEYQIIYRNGENANLVDISLEVFYPPDFEFKTAEPEAVSNTGQRFSLPDLKSGDDGTVTIRGKISGATGEEKELRAKLEYRLSNFNSQFSITANAKTVVLAPNLTLEITGPIDVTNGQDTTFTINYANVSNEEFENLSIVLNLPSGFSFTQSNPPPSKDDNQWAIPKLALEGRGAIEVTGSFTGAASQEKIMIAELGLKIGDNFAPLISSSASFKIVASSLYARLNAVPDDFVYLGSQISLNLEYGNQGRVGMTDIVIILSLEGTVLDLSRLAVNNAIVTNNVVTWKSATLSNLNVLSPNQDGEITLNIPLKSDSSTNLKNQVIKASATIASDQVPSPIKSNELAIKLGSRLGLSVSGQYVSGALPMKVGETTVFAVTFLVTNQSNDLEDVELIASLPLPSSAWTGVILPAVEEAKLSFDPNAGKVRWRLGDLPAFSGKFTPAPVVTFELQVTPTEADRGKSMKLLSDIQVSGRDVFTVQDVKSEEVREVSTSSLNDNKLNSVGATVQ